MNKVNKTHIWKIVGTQNTKKFKFKLASCHEVINTELINDIETAICNLSSDIKNKITVVSLKFVDSVVCGSKLYTELNTANTAKISPTEGLLLGDNAKMRMNVMAGTDHLKDKEIPMSMSSLTSISSRQTFPGTHIIYNTIREAFDKEFLTKLVKVNKKAPTAKFSDPGVMPVTFTYGYDDSSYTWDNIVATDSDALGAFKLLIPAHLSKAEELFFPCEK